MGNLYWEKENILMGKDLNLVCEDIFNNFSYEEISSYFTKLDSEEKEKMSDILAKYYSEIRNEEIFNIFRYKILSSAVVTLPLVPYYIYKIFTLVFETEKKHCIKLLKIINPEKKRLKEFTDGQNTNLNFEKEVQKLMKKPLKKILF